MLFKPTTNCPKKKHDGKFLTIKSTYWNIELSGTYKHIPKSSSFILVLEDGIVETLGRNEWEVVSVR